MHCIAEKGSSRKLDGYKVRRVPGCREPRRKDRLGFVGGGNNLASLLL